MEDLYRILQVDPIADPEVVEAAYRQLARKYHPDVYREPDAHERMQALNDAFAVLRDPTKRLAYDRQRARSAAPGSQPAAGVSPATGATSYPVGRSAREDKVAARLRREKIADLNALVQRLQAEMHAYTRDRNRHRAAVGALYLLGALVVAVLTAARAQDTPGLAPTHLYAMFATTGLLGVAGLAITSRAILAARARRADITNLRRQIKVRRQDLGRR